MTHTDLKDSRTFNSESKFSNKALFLATASTLVITIELWWLAIKVFDMENATVILSCAVIGSLYSVGWAWTLFYRHHYPSLSYFFLLPLITPPLFVAWGPPWMELGCLVIFISVFPTMSVFLVAWKFWTDSLATKL